MQQNINPIKQKYLLIVEDEKPMAKALELKLVKSGYKVKSIHDGEEAMIEIRKTPFDLILLDLMLPHLSGFEILELMQKEQIKSSVVVLSNLGQDEDFQKAKSLGAINYFVKANTPLLDIVEFINKTFK